MTLIVRFPPGRGGGRKGNWIPACAGMTNPVLCGSRADAEAGPALTWPVFMFPPCTHLVACGLPSECRAAFRYWPCGLPLLFPVVRSGLSPARKGQGKGGTGYGAVARICASIVAGSSVPQSVVVTFSSTTVPMSEPLLMVMVVLEAVESTSIVPLSISA